MKSLRKSVSAPKERKTNPLLTKDRWLANELGLEPEKAHGSYYLDFSGMTMAWLKSAVKRFVLLQSATKTYPTCRAYIQSLCRLDDYIGSYHPDLRPENLSRKIMVGFIQYLSEKKFSPSTKLMTLTGVRTFHQICVMEKWLPFPLEPIIFGTDLPKKIESIPKYIPEDILKQLEKNFKNLPDYLSRFIVILMETGRRVSEICTLPYHCLEQDSQNDWFLRVCERKMKRERLLPLSDKCVKAIEAQQEYLYNQGEERIYLFPAVKKAKTPYLSARTINHALAELSKRYNITDSHGTIWHFSSHQFRHTLATSMINSGVSQIMVQNYLGHESSEMTARYAHIHNETLKAAFAEYQEKLVDINGKPGPLELLNNAQWLKSNLASQSLPNGLCTLPMSQQRCPHANACLTCANFRTSKEYLPQHKEQLAKTHEIIDNANKNGWQRVAQANTDVANNLKAIIFRLEEA